MREEVSAPEKWRIFLALPLPTEVKEELRRAQSQLRQAIPQADIRWTSGAQMHLTLVFLGNVPITRVDKLTETSKSVCSRFAPFQLKAGDLGFFPEEGPPRVIWAGVRDDRGQLAKLQGELARAVAAFVEKPENKPFAAHLTLGRVNRLSSRELQMMKELARTISGQTMSPWQAIAIDLMRSELSSQGAHHERVAELPLAGAVTPYLPERD